VADSGETPESPRRDQQNAPPTAPGPWITRWQTVVVAVITAISGILVTAITVFGNDKGDTSPTPAAVPTVVTSPTTSANLEPQAVPPPQVPEASAKIQNIQFSTKDDGTRVITVAGSVDRAAVVSSPTDLDDYRAFAQPVNPATAQGDLPDGPKVGAVGDLSQSAIVYLSDRLRISDDGSWQAVINIVATEKRDLDVFMGVIQRGSVAGTLITTKGLEFREGTLYVPLSERKRISLAG
jgi:hypothetical protein